MNPCPCGYYGDPEHECSCSMPQILNYQKRLSGPLLDRIDMIIPVSRIPHEQLLDSRLSSETQHMSAQNTIENARNIQSQRYSSSKKSNSSLNNSEVKRFVQLSPTTKVFLDSAATKLKLSARSYFKIIKVARTIADIEASETVEIPHIAEALQYRQVTWYLLPYLLQYGKSNR